MSRLSTRLLHSALRRRPLRQRRFERLEDRITPALMSIEQAAARLQGHVNGVTVITHGYQPTNTDIPLIGGGDSLLPLAEAIQSKTNGWLLNYTIPSEGGVAGFNAE